MKRLFTILLVLAAVASACVSGDDTVASEDSGSADAAESAPTTPPTSVLRTIPEEASTTTIATTTTVEEELGPPPAPRWLDDDFELLTLATLEFPIALAARTGGDDLWIAEREGRIRQIQRRVSDDGNEQSLRLMNTIVLDISDQISTDGEGGLLGLTFSLNGRHLYVSYTDRDNNSVIAEYEMDTISALPETERILLQVEQPFNNHNGGDITMGPDGFLYIAFGDGGSSGDPEENGQDRQTLLGSILRIDPAEPTDGLAYRVPADNPFADGAAGRPETWLWGVRNPWRFSFDAGTGDMWVADVGQNSLEEITVLRRGAEPAGKGRNLGWRILEGDEFFDGDEVPEAYTAPIFTYDRSNGRCSVTGGYVYRGGAIPSLDGVYLFGDFCTGEVFGLENLDDGRIVVANLRLNRAPGQVIAFGQGSEGELYLLEGSGEVSLIRRPGNGPRTEVLDSDEVQLGGEIDDNVNIEPVPGDGSTVADG